MMNANTDVRRIGKLAALS